MAHSPKKQKSNAEKIDQLIWVVSSLAQSVQTMNERIQKIESAEPVVPEVVDPKEIVKEPVNYQTPYIVMKVDAIIPDDSVYGQGGVKKIFSGFKQVFNNRQEAGQFVDRMKREDPSAIYEMMPA